ncbi:glycosyltransferase family 2 protein [bacterium]|nr:glycosyltransferase family 2 protein [bacterium]
MELSVIIPAYNEEKRIESTLIKYVNFLNREFRKDFEIIVITDGTTDRTPEIVKNMCRKYSQITHIHPSERLGKGGAIKTGFKIAKGDIIGFIDADGSLSSKNCKTLIDKLKNYDGVIGSRRIKNRRVYDSFAREIGSKTFNFIVRLLFHLPFRDTQCGAKFFKKRVVKNVVHELRLSDWSFDVELLYRVRKNGFKIIEMKVNWNHKEGSKLKVSRASIKMFLSIIGLRVKLSFLSKIISPRIFGIIYEKVKKL